MAKKRTKRGGRAGATAQPKKAPPVAQPSKVLQFSMLGLSSPFDSEAPPASRPEPISSPPASSPALERAADAYAYRGADEAPFSQRVTIPAPSDVDTVRALPTMLPPPLPPEEAIPPVSHERVKAADPSEQDERPSDGTLERLAEAYEPSFFEIDDQRASPRVALEVELHVASDSHFFTGLSGDISEGGVFVSTYRPLKIGSEVDLEFTLPTSWQRVRARGRVRWHREASPGAPPGVGIAFEAIDDIDRVAIERFCTTHPPLYYDDVG